jgi:hypothetical protein
MATEAPAPPSSTPAIGDRGATRSSPAETLLALGVYAVLSLAFFGLKVLPHLGRDCACGFGNDPGTYMWYLAWWPHALLHGMNPFLTSAVFAPHHLDIGAVTLIPGPALLLAPVTLLAGPMVSYNVIALTSPILAALFAFLLCRYITRNFAAALVGGYLFGFSSYMLGHMLGHPNLVLTFPIPAGMHLVLRLMDRRITRRWFIGLMALDLAALVSFSTELALTFVLAGALTLVLALLFAPALRGVLLGALRALLLAGLIAAVVNSPLIYYAFKGNIAGAFAGAGDTWAGDLLGFVVPTRLTALGGSWFGGVSSRFTGNDIAESGIYIGIPLALMITCYVVPRWRRPLTRVLLCVLAIVSVLLLGSHLYVDGHSVISLPWRVISGLPLLREVLPVRLGVYVFLIAAVITALWLDLPAAKPWATAKWGLAAVSVVFLFPNIGNDLWHSQPSNPRFFTTSAYRQYIHRDETVLALPWPGFTGYGMLWQAETGMWFRLAGGYLGKLLPADYASDPLTPAFLHPEVAAVAPEMRSFLARHAVGAVVVDASNPQQWPGVLEQLGLRQQSIDGVLFYRVRSVPG